MSEKDDKARKVDQLAGPDSLADKLRKRRIAIEGGDPTGGMTDASDAMPGPDHYRGYTRQK